MPTPEIKARVSMDGSRWRSGLKDAEQIADKWGADVSKAIQGHLLAAFSINAVLKVAQASIDQFTSSIGAAGDLLRQARRADLGSLFEGSEQDKLAQSIEMIQQMGFALEQVGIQSDRVDDIFQDFSTRRIEALDGLANKDKDGKVKENDQLRAFRVLGITPDDLQKNTAPQLLFQLADSLKGAKATDEIKEAMDALFSDAGVDFLVLMREGLQDQMLIARQEGLVTGGEQILARDVARRRNLIKSRRAEIKKNQANTTGEGLTDLKQDATVGLFDAIGTPSEVATGVGISVMERLGIAVEKLEGVSTQHLRETLEAKKFLRQISESSQETSRNTQSLAD